MRGTEFTRVGLGYSLRIAEIGTEISVGRLTKSRGEIHGMLRVISALPGVRAYDGTLFAARVNLSSDTSRKQVAKALNERAPSGEVDWIVTLDEFCTRVINGETAGEPVILVGALPRPMGVVWRLDPIIPAGKPVILYGEGGTGKSTLATAFGISVQTGIALIEGFIPRQAEVLYLDWESDRDEINDRVRGVAMGAHIPHVVQLRYRGCVGPIADQAEEIAARVAADGIGLVIVDSVGLAAGTSGDGSDAAESALRLFSAFRVITSAHPGCSILAVDHVSKAETEVAGRPSRPYGSIYKTNLARAMFEVRRSDTNIGLYHTKSNIAKLLAPIAMSVEYDEDDGAITYRRLSDIPIDLTKPLRLGLRIAAFLRNGHLTVEEIADLVDAKPEVIRATLNRDKDHFNRLASGAWEYLERAG